MANTPRPSTPRPSGETAKVGDTFDIEGPGALVVLPGGTVVTARTGYTFRHAGEHTIIAERTETKVEVSAK